MSRDFSNTIIPVAYDADAAAAIVRKAVEAEEAASLGASGREGSRRGRPAGSCATRSTACRRRIGRIVLTRRLSPATGSRSK